ncbi:hypothetical protein NGTWS1803_37740 [Mycolicibacterium cyprinidarum]|nr:hypothetical protein NGTWS1803_37740 [Mycolicibacterium sp. NGTWS1803]
MRCSCGLWVPLVTVALVVTGEPAAKAVMVAPVRRAPSCILMPVTAARAAARVPVVPGVLVVRLVQARVGSPALMVFQGARLRPVVTVALVVMVSMPRPRVWLVVSVVMVVRVARWVMVVLAAPVVMVAPGPRALSVPRAPLAVMVWQAVWVVAAVLVVWVARSPVMAVMVVRAVWVVVVVMVVWVLTVPPVAVRVPPVRPVVMVVTARLAVLVALGVWPGSRWGSAVTV